MTAVEIIAKKRDGNKLSKEDISFFVDSFISGDIKDYQMSALLMAIFLRGMDFDETASLTETMLRSGKVIQFPEPNEVYVDKHSSGGVGDKVSLILAPWVAACGVKVPMLSGRGLGHTGGTLDKLESIPGFRTNLTLDEFRRGVERVGCVITGQTPEIAPADKLIYALRDVTATVESIPLICGSILSKKLAAGPSGIIFDVKCGNGAFMKNLKAAESLALNLIGVARALGRHVRAIITDMSQPLGRTAGNMLEVIECIDALKGKCAADLYAVTIELAIEMLDMAGIERDRRKALAMLKSRMDDGSAFRKFDEMVTYQGGDLSKFMERKLALKAPVVMNLEAKLGGFVQSFETEKIGRLIVEMGAGRLTKDDAPDLRVGIVFHKKIGDEIRQGETLAEIHAKSDSSAEHAVSSLSSLIIVGAEKRAARELILKRLM